MRRSSALAALADVVCVLVFCTIGRRSHAEGLTVAGVAETAWPFLAGTAIGWLLVRGWRRPTAVAPTGVVVWVCTVAVGMLLRKATSAGVAVSFVVVASAATAVLLLGWRVAVAAVQRRRISPDRVESSGGSGEVDTVRVARRPPSGLSESTMLPPCSAACWATSARPSPEPPGAAVLPRAKRPSTFSCSSAGSPRPLSSTVIVIVWSIRRPPARSWSPVRA